MPASIARQLDPMRRRGRSPWRWLAALSCAALLAACAGGGTGGSGSSGFDIRAENAAIAEALASQDCQVNAGLTICPSGGEVGPTASPSPTATPSRPAFTATAAGSVTATATPVVFASPTATFHVGLTATPSATPTVTPVPAPAVQTNIGSSDVVPCTAAAGAPCVFLFTFQPSGFPASATYGVAFRQRHPDGDWQLVATSGFAVSIPLDPAVKYQLAVLVFLGDDGSAPGPVDALGLTDASYAFVTPVVSVEAQ